MTIHPLNPSLKARSGERAFTMIEIALSLAIVAFALVAIMGVLPAGINVQKDNREDTLMKSEAQYFLDALRSGAHGIDDLTNFVQEVRREQLNPLGKTNVKGTATWTPGYLDGERIIGALLVKDRFTFNGAGETNFNRAFALVRPINGAAAEKVKITSQAGFRYKVEADLVPAYSRTSSNTFSTNFSSTFNPAFFNNLAYSNRMVSSLYELRVTVSWPVFERGANNWSVGNSRKTLSALVSGNVTTGFITFAGVTEPMILSSLNPNQF